MSKKYITDVIKIDGQLLDGNGSAGTSGQVLSSTGTATDWVSLSEISGVDGSGTANYLAKWADGDSITNSIIYDNGTNVGIGTPSPGYPLDIAGFANSSSGFRVTDGTIDNRISWSSGNVGFFGTISNHPIAFNTNLTERIRITSGGNVGIGTTDPKTKLNVAGSSADGGGVLTLENTTTATGSLDYVGKIQFYGNDSGTGANGVRASIMADIQGYNGETDLVFSTANTSSSESEAMRIDQYGNVGIGTTDPASKLHVASNSGTVNELYVTQQKTYGVGTGTSERAAIILGISESGISFSDRKFAVIETGPESEQSSANSFLAFQTRVGGGTTEKMRIDSSGDVGIGTTNPLDKLSVEGNSSNLLKIRNTTNAGGASIEFNDNGSSEASQNGTITYYHSDAVSQGGGASFWFEAEPDTVLVVGNSTNKGRIAVSSQNSSAEVDYGFRADTDTGMYSPAADQVGLVAGGSRKLLVSGDGVTIQNGGLYLGGTVDTNTSSTTALVLNGTEVEKRTLGSAAFSNTGDFAAASHTHDDRYYTETESDNRFVNVTGDTMTGGLNIEVSTSNTQLKLKRTTSATGEFNIYTNNDSLFFQNVGQSTYPMMINSSGYVGIGTTSPSSDLDVVGNTRLGPDSEHAFQVTDDSTNNFLVLSSTQRTTASAARDIKFRSYGTDATDNVLVMDMSNGNVGIGTSSPDRQLQVHESTSGTSTAKFTNSTTGEDGDTGFFVGINGSEQPILYGYNSTDMIIGTNGGERMRITSGGNVGIGTTDPGTYKLYVSGTTQLNGEVSLPSTGIATASVNYPSQTLRLTTSAWDTNNSTARFVHWNIRNEGTSTIYPDGTLTFYEEDVSYNHWKLKLPGRGSGDSYIHPDAALFNGIIKIYESDTSNLNVLINPSGDSYFNGGNVGIGTISPAQKLHVVGKALITDDIQLTGSNPRIDFNSNGASSLRFYDTTNASERMRIDTAGNVGIGTTNPSEKLHVVGNIQLGDGGTGSSINYNSTDRGTLKVGGSEIMRLLASGNVGIGTTSPLDQLHVAGTIRAVSPATTEWGLIAQNNVGAASSGIWFENGDGELLLRDDADNINVRLRSDAASYINGGNVGIGTTSPGSELEVDGEITTTTLTYDEPGALDSSAYNGEIVYFGTQISMTEGKLMVLSSSAGGLTWYLAKDSTTSLATGMLGIALGTTASAGVLVRGIAKNSAWSSFSEGDKLYLSPTGGSISNSITTDTNDFVRIVGYALGGSKIYFCPDNTYIQNA